MLSEKSQSKSINFEKLINDNKERCSENLKNIEDLLSPLNKLEIISRLSILTQTELGRETLEGYFIIDYPSLHFIIGLALKSDFCGEIEPSNQDIDKILRTLELYFKNLFFSEIPTSGKKDKTENVIIFAKMHALIGQINPGKYPFQMMELLSETFGHLDDYFTEKYGFTISDAIEFSKKIIHQYENSIISKYEIGQQKNSSDEEKWTEFYSRSRDLLAIVPSDFCEEYNCDIAKFRKYLTIFSCNFGEGDPTYNSPLDVNLFLKKPIFKKNDQYFAPIPQDLFQKLPSIFEELLETEKRERTIIWQKYQKSKAKFTENKVTEYLGRIFKKDRIYENLFSDY